MKWLAKHTQVQPSDGTTRLHRRFAWMPVYVAGWNLWLGGYEVLQVYKIEKFITEIDGKETGFLVGKWIDLSKRIIE